MEPFSLVFLAIGVYLLFLIFTRTRKQQKQIQQTQAGLAPGVDVMTTAGLFAKVIELDEQTVVLETGPGQRSRWDRRAVARVLTPADSSTSLRPGVGAGDDAGGAGARLRQEGADGERGGSGASADGPAPPDRA